MLENYGRPIKTSILISALVIGAIGIASAIGIAEAAPDLGNSAYWSVNPLLLVKNAADPAGGHFNNVMPPRKLAMQNVSEFTHVGPPSFLSATGKFLPAALAINNPTSQSSSLRAISEETAHKSLTQNESLPIMLLEVIYQAMQPSAGSCKTLDAKLDRQHLPSVGENAILAKHGCGINSTRSTES
jgi:hypothetical protein